jgi:hypothetical protein
MYLKVQGINDTDIHDKNGEKRYNRPKVFSRRKSIDEDLP